METFPASRQFTIDMGQLALKKHHVRALIEVDVTEARQRLDRAKANGAAPISFTSWVLKCLASALVQHPKLNALRLGSNRRVLFRDVDISVMVEREIDGEPVPLPVVIRSANSKSIAEINSEIRSAKTQSTDNGSPVLGESRTALLTRLALLLPGWVRLLVWKFLLKNPFRVKQMMGNVIVSSIGTAGAMRGWAIPVTIHPLSLTLGPVSQKPGVFQNRISIREYLPITILLDHDLVDGMPMARFIADFTQLLENCSNLPEMER